ncbi:glycosyl hydrolase family 98 [bacterium]|nr:glycosyl hydrolase family 98 [bacterium]
MVRQRVLLLGLMVLSCVTSGWTADLPDAAAQVKAARAILDPWQEKYAAPVDRYLHIVCWTPSDREFPADYKGRLTRMLQHIQAFYAQEMERHGFDQRSIRLQLNDQQQVVIHEVRGTHPTSHYAKNSGSEIRKECLPVLEQAGIHADNETIAIFCNLAQWDAEKLTFTHESPYYAGGSYRQGTAWQLDSPELDSNNLPLKTPMMRDGQYGRISLGKHNSIFIGGMAHEFGHALGLPHCVERPDEAVRGSALMGSGNRTYGDELREEGRGSFLTLAHALRLASHPQFSGRLEQQSRKPEATVTNIAVKAVGKSITVSGVVKGNPPVYAVVAYFDPAGNSDYNATTATAVPDRQGRFELQTDALTKDRSGDLRLCLLHANGAVTDSRLQPQLKYPYAVAADGTPDLSTIEMRLALAPLIQALNQRDQERAQRLARNLKSPEAQAIAHKLISPESRTETPAEFSGTGNVIELTHFKLTSEKVGWIRPSYDRLPDNAVLLEADGRIFATGIYAHAPAQHEYALAGKWSKLTGQAALAGGHGGTVQFEIHGDGRELWKSPVISANQRVPFDVDLTGVQKLELITSTTPDGAGDDWGLWLEPQLHRQD